MIEENKQIRDGDKVFTDKGNGDGISRHPNPGRDDQQMATELNALSAPARRSSLRMAGVVITSTVIAVLAAALLVCGTQHARAQTAPTQVDNRAVENGPNNTKSATELNKELSNPISPMWSIAFQENTYLAEHVGWQFGSQCGECAVSTGAADITD
jgi:predicted metalloprotease